MFSVLKLRITAICLVLLAASGCEPTLTYVKVPPVRAVDLANSTVEVSSASIVAGATTIVVVTARDQYGDLFYSPVTSVALSYSGGVSTLAFSSVTDLGDGTYIATATGVTSGAATTVHATLNGGDVTSTLPSVAVSTGAYTLANSIVSLSASSVTEGSTITATLTAYDVANNQLGSGGLTVLFSNSGGTSAGTWGPTLDNNDGTYTAVFTSTTYGTATTISASIAGSAVTSTLPTLTVNPVMVTTPTGLAAAASPGSITLSWTASTGTAPITYAVKRATTSGGPYTTLSSGITVTNYTDSTVTNGTSYYYVVDATNPGGSSSNSAEVGVQSIAAFTISSVTVNSASALDVSWPSVAGASSYTLKYGTATGVYGTTVSNSATSPTTVNGLTPGTTYYFMVSAVNAVGAGATQNATAEVTGVPESAFSISSVTQPTTQQATVSWSASTGATSYTLKYGTASGGPYGTTVSTSATSPTTVTGLTNGTTYYFQVYAVNGNGSLASTSEGSITPIATPSVPTGLTATAGTANIALSWTASTGSSPLYTVYRSTTSGSGYSALAACTSQVGTTCTDLTAANGTTYYYVVQSSNAGGTSANSAEVSALPISTFSMTSVAVSGGSTLDVTWPAVAGATSYTLKYGTTSGVYGTTVSTSATSPTSVGSLTPGTTYYFMVTATNAVGGGNSVNSSSEISGVPMSAFTLSAGARALTSLGTSWTASTGATSYTLKYGTATGVYGTTFSTSATSPTTITGLANGTTYYIRVTAVNGSGSLDSTAELAATTLAATSKTWPFDAAPDPTLSYLFDGTKIDFTGGVCRLTVSDQTDDNGASSGFGGGQFYGIADYGTLTGESSSSGLRLGNNSSCDGSTSSCAQLALPELYQMDSTWTPQWANIGGLWHLDGTVGAIASGATVSDSSGRNAHGTMNTASGTYVTGKIAQGLTVPSSTYASVPAAAAPNPCFTVSVAFWAKTTSTGSYVSPIRKSGGSSASGGWMIQKIGTQSNYQIRIDTDGTPVSGTGIQSSGTTINDGNWHHVAFTLNNGTGILYIDGAQNVTGTYAAGSVGFCSNTNLTLGADMAVTLDEVAVWTSVLTPTEIASIYNRQAVKYSGVFTSRVMDAYNAGQVWNSLAWTPTLPFFKALPDGGSANAESTSVYSSLTNSTLLTGLQGLWHMNGTVGVIADGATITNSSGTVANHDGTAADADASNTIAYVDGRFGQGILFDGTNDYVSVSDHADFESNTLTVSAWILGQPCTNCVIMSHYDSTGSQRAWNMRASAGATGSKRLTVHMNKDGGAAGTSYKEYTSSVTIMDGQFHHVAFTFDAGTLKLYIDGVEDTAVTKTVDSAVTVIKDSTAPLGIGGMFFSGALTQPFKGLIDEAAIWTRVLDATEMKQLYQRGASRIKYQVRSCSEADTTCASGSWKGPDGSSSTFFSELFNMTTQAATPSGSVLKTAPSMTLQNYSSPVAANRRFQYRAIFESDTSTSAMQPELKSVVVGDPHYDKSSPTVVSKSGLSYYSLSDFIESIGAGGCSGGVVYNLGVGATYDIATWYYWNGSAWVSDGGTASISTANTQAELATAGVLSSFGTQVGTGTVYIRAFLKSSGTSACELDNLQLDGYN